jgi:putative flippase GtrA
MLKIEFARYLVVGGIAFCADFGLLALLTAAFDVHYLVASLFAFLLGTWVNYRLSVRWVFAFRAVSAPAAEFSMFMLIGVITLGLSLGLMALLVDALGLHILLAKCVVTGFTLITNFAARRAVLFTRSRLRSSAEVRAQP